MKIGVSSYSFSQLITAEKLDAVSVLHKAAEMGFDAIEYTDFNLGLGQDSALVDTIVRDAKEKGIELSAYVVGGNLLQSTQAEQNAEVERLKGQIDVANRLGVKLFRYDVTYAQLPMYMSFDMALEKVADAMRELASYGQSLGIVTMIENHGMTFQDSDRIERVYSRVNHPNFRLLVDMGNFMCADEDTTLAVSRLRNLAAHVHAKDFEKIDYYSNLSKEDCFQTRAQNYLRGTAVGEGDVKAAQCVDILKAAGYDGYIDIEYEGPEDCIAALSRGLEFLKKIV